MDIQEAIAAILGATLADALIRNQGLEWAVTVAEAKISADEDPKAVETIVAWLAVRRAPGSQHQASPARLL
jgi:hypothetical protein